MSDNNNVVKVVMNYLYDNNDSNYYITETGDELMTKPKKDTPTTYTRLYKGYERSLEGLIQFRTEFNAWCNELINSPNKYVKFDFKNNFSTTIAAKNFLMCRCGYKFRKYGLKMEFDEKKGFGHYPENDPDIISCKESYVMEYCNNGALITLDPKFKNVKIKCVGYDHAAYYQNLLCGHIMIGAKRYSKLIIPHKAPTFGKILTLDEKTLKFGIYKVNISCNNCNFNKIFAYSKKGWYTIYSVLFALENTTRFNVKVELDVSRKINAMTWEDDQWVETQELFENWGKCLNTAKDLYPDNRLVKVLSSELWGSLTQYKRFFVDYDDIDENYSFLDEQKQTEFKILNTQGRTVDDSFKMTYVVCKKDQMYKDPKLARIKPFLSSFARINMARLILSENLIDCSVRIHTDCVVLSREHDFTHLEYYPKFENKSSGVLTWLNAMHNNKTEAKRIEKKNLKKANEENKEKKSPKTKKSQKTKKTIS